MKNQSFYYSFSRQWFDAAAGLEETILAAHVEPGYVASKSVRSNSMSSSNAFGCAQRRRAEA